MAKLEPPTPDDIEARRFEEKPFESVAAELAGGYRSEGLWIKAIAHSEGSEASARSLYIRYRAQSILDDAAWEQFEAQRCEEEARERAQRCEEEARERDRIKGRAEAAEYLRVFGLMVLAVVIGLIVLPVIVTLAHG